MVEAVSGVIEEVLVAVPEHQLSESAENEVHEYKLTRKIALLNPDKMYGKQGVFIVIAKEKPVVVTTDISFKFHFS